MSNSRREPVFFRRMSPRPDHPARTDAVQVRRYAAWCSGRGADRRLRSASPGALHCTLAAAAPSTSVPPPLGLNWRRPVRAATWCGCVVPGSVRQCNPRPAVVPHRGRRRTHACRRWKRLHGRRHSAEADHTALEVGLAATGEGTASPSLHGVRCFCSLSRGRVSHSASQPMPESLSIMPGAALPGHRNAARVTDELQGRVDREHAPDGALMMLA